MFELLVGHSRTHRCWPQERLDWHYWVWVRVCEGGTRKQVYGKKDVAVELTSLAAAQPLVGPAGPVGLAVLVGLAELPHVGIPAYTADSISTRVGSGRIAGGLLESHSGRALLRALLEWYLVEALRL